MRKEQAFEERFNIVRLLLADLQYVMGDNNYQIYFDGEVWGIVMDGTFSAAGETLQDLIDYFQEVIRHTKI